MDDRHVDIVKAAWAMFARYGFGKTTMSDIATEAGVARQTVYNAFSSKEDILRAVMRLAGDQSLAAILDAWEKDTTLAAKLETFQTLGPLAWFEAVQAAPDWGELMDGMNRHAAPILQEMEAKWVAALTDMLGAYSAGPAETAADFLYTSSKNAKYGLEDIAVLRRRLSVINAATIALLKDQT